MDATLAGLVGAVIGSAASLIGLAIQQHYQSRRDRAKTAADLGLAEFRHDLELAKAAGGGHVAPLAGYVIYYSRFLDVMSKGSITPEAVKALLVERDAILAAFPGAPE